MYQYYAHFNEPTYECSTIFVCIKKCKIILKTIWHVKISIKYNISCQYAIPASVQFHMYPKKKGNLNSSTQISKSFYWIPKYI